MTSECVTGCGERNLNCSLGLGRAQHSTQQKVIEPDDLELFLSYNLLHHLDILYAHRGR